MHRRMSKSATVHPFIVATRDLPIISIVVILANNKKNAGTVFFEVELFERLLSSFWPLWSILSLWSTLSLWPVLSLLSVLPLRSLLPFWSVYSVLIFALSGWFLFGRFLLTVLALGVIRICIV